MLFSLIPAVAMREHDLIIWIVTTDVNVLIDDHIDF